MWVGTRRQFNGLVIGGLAMMLTKNFSSAEMMCSCGCGEDAMDPDFMSILQNIRDEMQRPLRISSGVRCVKRNMEVSSTGKMDRMFLELTVPRQVIFLLLVQMH